VGKGEEEKGVTYLDEKTTVINRERYENGLKDFAESGTVNTCYAQCEPGFTNSPALNARMDPRVTYN
jgi:hypothetical protein